MTNPSIRDSKIPCQNCRKGTLYWNHEEKLYVCIECGTQEPALKTWIDAAEYRKKKKQKKRDIERQWALEILGVKDQLKTPKKSKQEKDWDEILELIEEKESKT
ncbi:MAG: hypothetical protein ACXAC8_12490 [Candidatus Hodarchaeales archaeon]|jgi:hypothetical protein